MMETTDAFTQRVRKRFQALLDVARTQHAAEADARETAIQATARALRADGFCGLTDADVRRSVRERD